MQKKYGKCELPGWFDNCKPGYEYIPMTDTYNNGYRSGAMCCEVLGKKVKSSAKKSYRKSKIRGVVREKKYRKKRSSRK